MTIEDELVNMYSKRLERKEIKQTISSSTIYQHQNNITKIHQAITGNIPQLFGQMGWLEEKTGEEIFEMISTRDKTHNYSRILVIFYRIH